ncbi:MAG: voltage-gated chloride channel protein [Clostridium sp.]|nr:voltage-gated chloride channel protein [Clostridium sp.]
MNKLHDEYKEMFILSVAAIFLGVIVGIIDTVFGRVLIAITEFREGREFYLLPFLSLAGLLIVFLYTRYGKNSIKGMSLVFNKAHGEKEEIPKRLVPLVMITTWVTHLFGGSAGREGVAVQIGGTIGNVIGRKIGIDRKLFIITGMAAGFSGLFQTPIAAIFFALEVLVVGQLEYKALLSSIIAAFIASVTSHTLGLEKFSVILNTKVDLNAEFIVKLVIIGIIFGLVGSLFALFLGKAKLFFADKIKSPMKRIFIMGIALSVILLLLHKGRYSGLGTNLISMSFSGNEIYLYDWAFKLILTVFTLAAGFQGGEVTPLFSIGAALGVVLATNLNMPIELIAALGYASVFGSATNTLLAPIFIGAEVFGFEYMPYFVICCALAYIFNGNKSIYGAQKK